MGMANGAHFIFKNVPLHTIKTSGEVPCEAVPSNVPSNFVYECFSGPQCFDAKANFAKNFEARRAI